MMMRVVRFSYTIDNHITSLNLKITFTSSSDVEVILEACFLKERFHLVVSDASYTYSFYFYIPTTHEVRVHLPFSSFDEEVLVELNVDPF